MFVDYYYFLRYTHQRLFFFNNSLFRQQQSKCKWLKCFLKIPGFLVSELVVGSGEQDQYSKINSSYVYHFHRVNLIKADKLMKKDVGVLGMGKSDPYAVLEVGSKSGKTKVISNTITPEWFYTIDFPIEVVKGQQLTIEVFDHDDPGK